MYRIVSKHRVSFHGVSAVPSQTIMQLSAQMCSYCNFHHRKLVKSVMYFQTRSRITLNPTLNPTQSTAKKKIKNKKYAELLEISHHVTNRRAAIKKLNASEVSILLHQPDITMDRLHKLKDFNYIKQPIIDRNIAQVNAKHTTGEQERTAISNVNENLYEKMSDSQELNSLNRKNESEQISETIEKLQGIINANNCLVNEKIFSNTPQKRGKAMHLDAYTKTLAAYVDVYLAGGNLNLAAKALLQYRQKIKKQKGRHADAIIVYNQLMSYFASRGDINNVSPLYEAIKMDKITPTPQTFAYIFEAFGRTVVDKKHKEILYLLKSDMEKYGIGENDILTKSSFTHNQETIALNGIRLLNPEFQPVYPAPNTESSCHLLKNNEEISNSSNTVSNLFMMDGLHKNMLEQLKAEFTNEVTVDSIAKHDDTLESRYCQKLIETIEKRWEQAIRSSFQRSVRFLKRKEQATNNTVMYLHPFMEVLDEQEYIDIMMNMIREITTFSDGYSPTKSRIQFDLGTKMHRRYLNRRWEETGALDSMIDTYLKYLDWYLNRTRQTDCATNNINHRIVWQFIEHNKRKCGTLVDVNIPQWPAPVLYQIGEFLLNIILNNVKISGTVLKNFDLPGEMPAFYTIMRVQNTYYTQQLKAHPVLSQIYDSAPNRKLYFSPKFIPSFNLPVPRTSTRKGIYFTLDSDFVRPQDGNDADYIHEDPLENLYPVMDALNDLGSVPWAINSSVLDVAIQVFQNGGSVDLDVPLSSKQFDITPPKNVLAREGTTGYKSFFKKEKSEMYSLWCEALYRLSIANHFRNRIFWLPHNLDFRGRAYTIAPYLSHLTGDLGRSLLVFAEKKRLGPKGLDWLKIHLINLTGLKKKSCLVDRLKYADEIMSDILDSAENPLTGKMWWTKSDEPWQTLATCMELANALKHPKPEEYESSFPLHQDGSCNGLQHYAALGRDAMGAKSVNLHPCATPQDVYSAITSIVEKHRTSDAKRKKIIAQKLEGHVERKVIKQTIMTTVYGVTRYGSKLQIYKQLKERDLLEKDAWDGSSYLSDLTFKSLGTVFKSASQIQQWLVDLSQIVSKEYGDNMQWRTPLNLPVSQLYQKTVGTNSKKPNGAQVKETRPDSRKQKNAFAPNFIHSLDSTHMMLTCLESHKKGITFVAIHDCYWTHACTIDTMNEICREKFVALHSEPILENLAKEVLTRYTSEEWQKKMEDSKKTSALKHLQTHLNNIPEKGEFDIKNVLSSVYFFS